MMGIKTGGRHARRDADVRRTVAIYLTISFAVAFAAIAAATVVRATDGLPAAASGVHAPAAAPTSETSIAQQGRLVAVSATSVTAQGSDGVSRTYVVTDQTNAITDAGSAVGGTANAFVVNDEVAIVGVLRDGTAVATAVAHRDVSQLDGPPMDFVSP